MMERSWCRPRSVEGVERNRTSMRKWPAIIVLGFVWTVLYTMPSSVARGLSEEPAPWQLSIDCNTSLTGVQAECDYQSGAAVDVAIVIENVSGDGALPLRSFGFRVLGGGTDDPGNLSLARGLQALMPLPGADENLNANPDFSDAISGVWECNDPPPSLVPLPNGIEFNSSIACRSESGPSVPVGSALVLATLRFTATGSPGIASMSVRFPTITSTAGVGIVEACNFGGSTTTETADCGNATVWIGRTQPPVTVTTVPAEPTATAPAGMPALTKRVNITNEGRQESYSNHPRVFDSSRDPWLSRDGKTVAFYAQQALVPDDLNEMGDIYVHNRESSRTERVSLNEANTEFPIDTFPPTLPLAQSMSSNGQNVSFGAPGAGSYVRERVSQQSVHLPDLVHPGRISPDGRYLAFQTNARLVPEDFSSSDEDIYLLDYVSGDFRLVTTYPSSDGDFLRVGPVSANARFVVFTTTNRFVFPGIEPQDGLGNIYVRDMLNNTTTRVDVDSNGERQSGGNAEFAAMSSDGRFVAFEGGLPIVGLPDDGQVHVFLRDMRSESTVLVDLNDHGVPSARGGGGLLGVSDYGRYVSFQSRSPDLPGAFSVRSNGEWVEDVYVRDTRLGITERISVRLPGIESFDDACGTFELPAGSVFRDCSSGQASIDETGRFVAFVSEATNLVNGDTNSQSDVFLRDRCPDGSCEDHGEVPPPNEADLSALGDLSLVPPLIAHGADVAVTLDVFVRSATPSISVQFEVEVAANVPPGCLVRPETAVVRGTFAQGLGGVEQDFVVRCDDVGSKSVAFEIEVQPVGTSDPSQLDNFTTVGETFTSALLYIAAGDSIVAGTDLGHTPQGCPYNPGCYADPFRAYPTFVRSSYESRSAGKKVLLRNVACDGETSIEFIAGDSRGLPRCKTADLMTQLEFIRSGNHGKPDLVTLTIGADDLIRFAIEHDECVVKTAALGWPPRGNCKQLYEGMRANLKVNLQTVLSYLKANGIRTIITGYPHVYCRTGSRGVPHVFNNALDDINGVIRAAARENNVTFVNLVPDFRGHENSTGPGSCSKRSWMAERLGPCDPGIPACYLPGFHPNVLGQRQIANAVVQKLRR